MSDLENKPDKSGKDDNASWHNSSIAFGICIGVTFGILTHHLAICLSLGIVFGIVLNRIHLNKKN